MAVFGLCTASPLGPNLRRCQIGTPSTREGDEIRTHAKHLPNRATVPQTAHSTDGDAGGNISVTLQPGHLRSYSHRHDRRKRTEDHGLAKCKTILNVKPSLMAYLACEVTVPHLAHSIAFALRRQYQRKLSTDYARESAGGPGRRMRGRRGPGKGPGKEVQDESAFRPMVTGRLTRMGT